MRKGYFFLLGFSFVLALMLPGCKSADPLTRQNLERAWQVWEEDRRADLPEDKIKAREFERDQAFAYEDSKGGK